MGTGSHSLTVVRVIFLIVVDLPVGSSLPPSLFPQSLCSPLVFMPPKFIEFTPEEIAKAPLLEPALEGLLRSQNLHEEVV